jgi:outer membrane protein assembly factor BamD (BamD/ComL family)
MVERHFQQVKLVCNTILLLLLLSCSHEKKADVEQYRDDVDLSNTEMIHLQSEASALLAKGDIQSALDLYKNTYYKHQTKKTLIDQYVKTIQTIYNAADRAFAIDDYYIAGKSYTILLRNYKYFKGLRQQLSFNRESLRERIQECRTQLFKKGLQQYRSGFLQDAVSTWQSLIAFIPNDEETRRAMNTASVQLKRMQNHR